MTRVPLCIAKQFGGAHHFRMRARKLVRKLHCQLGALRRGCAFFPAQGYNRIRTIQKELDQLKTALSIKNWGR